MNAFLCVQYVRKPSPTTFDVSLITHFILASGVFSNLTLCGSSLHHNFGRVLLLPLFFFHFRLLFFLMLLFILLLVWMWFLWSSWWVVCMFLLVCGCSCYLLCTDWTFFCTKLVCFLSFSKFGWQRGFLPMPLSQFVTVFDSQNTMITYRICMSRFNF